MGTRRGALAAGNYVGHTAAAQALVLARASAADQVALTHRVRVGFRQPAGTYTATVTYALTPANYAAEVRTTPGLVGLWRLDEQAGTAAAEGVGTAHGTYVGGVGLDQLGPVGGSTAARFDGVDDHVDAGDVHDLAGNAPFSVEAWFNRGSLGESTTYRRVVAKHRRASPREGWTLMVYPDEVSGAAQTVGFERWSGDANVGDVRSTTATAAGRWYHVVVTYDGATLRLHLNGALEDTEAAGGLPDTTVPLRIGSSSSNTGRFDGEIDEVAIYDRALTAEEVRRHWDAR